MAIRKLDYLTIPSTIYNTIESKIKRYLFYGTNNINYTTLFSDNFK